MKSEIPANLFLGQDYLERIRVLTMADLNDPRRKGATLKGLYNCSASPAGLRNRFPNRLGREYRRMNRTILAFLRPTRIRSQLLALGPLIQACRVPSVEYFATDRSDILTNQSRPFPIR